MTTVTLDDIERDLRSFLHLVEAGESILIVADGKAVAELRPVQPLVTQLRPVGLSAGLFTVPDDFNEPLPDDIVDLFEGR